MTSLVAVVASDITTLSWTFRAIPSEMASAASVTCYVALVSAGLTFGLRAFATDVASLSALVARFWLWFFSALSSNVITSAVVAFLWCTLSSTSRAISGSVTFLSAVV